ncbi:hypothetical protein Scep_009741 [Stephania cephalantha]|uniref:Uncharacterized protein n=1 Tax=Stephania cephalantha TaxID=152367 RepID=A0AAP0JUR9_9MAGN
MNGYDVEIMLPPGRKYGKSVHVTEKNTVDEVTGNLRIRVRSRGSFTWITIISGNEKELKEPYGIPSHGMFEPLPERVRIGQVYALPCEPHIFELCPGQAQGSSKSPQKPDKTHAFLGLGRSALVCVTQSKESLPTVIKALHCSGQGCPGSSLRGIRSNS